MEKRQAAIHALTVFVILAILVIAEENEDNYEISSWKAVVVDGDKVKPDTWYKLQDGELVEYNE